ncbi:MAG: hypothetical protein K0R98_1836 [Rickettsiaceae bacterium]|jgi:ankyrin repeat protein|nr:hypothetical protein [Rickettsiaceae bacterium]
MAKEPIVIDLHYAMCEGVETPEKQKALAELVAESNFYMINKINKAGFTPLAVAAILGRDKTLKFFLDEIKRKFLSVEVKAIVNYQMRGQFFKTAMHLAIEYNRKQFGDVLIAEGANLNLITRIGFSPFDRAYGIGAGFS